MRSQCVVPAPSRQPCLFAYKYVRQVLVCKHSFSGKCGLLTKLYRAASCACFDTMTSLPKVRDFIRPIDSETSYCEMLQAHNKHQWSSDGLTWVTPDFYRSDIPHNGGSATNWPRDKGRAGDERVHLSFWGDARDDGRTGGCCSTSTATYSTGSYWGQSCKYRETKLRTPAAG